MERNKLISELNTLQQDALIGIVERQKRYKKFQSEIEHIINSNSIDSDLNVQDFVIADYVIDCLRNLKITLKRRDELK